MHFFAKTSTNLAENGVLANNSLKCFLFFHPIFCIGWKKEEFQINVWDRKVVVWHSVGSFVVVQILISAKLLFCKFEIGFVRKEKKD